MASIDINLENVNIKQCKNIRSVFYKKPIKKCNYNLDVDNVYNPQELRRQQLLEIQKKNRNIMFNTGRDIFDIFNSKNKEYEDKEDMEIEYYNNKSWRKYERCKQYANQFMLSEWMFEAPQDILEKWMVVPCPEGKRTLLIAHKNKTKAFNKRGIRLGKFQSALPGGSSNEHSSRCTILDCIWIESRKTYYVLDVLAWSNQSLINCDTEFRFFWLISKFQEIQELQRGDTYNNRYPILLLPHINFDCNLESSLGNLNELTPLDGLLFYHRDGLYTKGRTPLVTWLKLFMLPEILGISLPPFDEKPDGYVDIRQYLLNLKGKKNNSKSQITSMDIVDEEVEMT